MKHNVNIVGNNRTFKYVAEYNKGTTGVNDYDIKWYKEDRTIHLHTEETQYRRNKNDWYSIDFNDNELYKTNYIPTNDIILTKVRVYLPIHSVSTYIRGVKYMLTLNTWFGNYKIDLGSYLFRPMHMQYQQVLLELVILNIMNALILI